jgi:hypothetical protein
LYLARFTTAVRTFRFLLANAHGSRPTCWRRCAGSSSSVPIQTHPGLQYSAKTKLQIILKTVRMLLSISIPFLIPVQAPINTRDQWPPHGPRSTSPPPTHCHPRLLGCCACPARIAGHWGAAGSGCQARTACISCTHAVRPRWHAVLLAMVRNTRLVGTDRFAAFCSVMVLLVHGPTVSHSDHRWAYWYAKMPAERMDGWKRVRWMAGRVSMDGTRKGGGLSGGG